MKMKLAGMLIALGAGSTVFAQSLEIDSAAGVDPGGLWTMGNVQDSAGADLAIGSLILYGNFGALNDATLAAFASGGLTPAELATINGDFSQAFSWQVGDGNAADGTFDVLLTNPNATAFSLEPAYMLVYKGVTDVADVDLATEFGIIRNVSDFPAIGGLPASFSHHVDPNLGTAILGAFEGSGIGDDFRTLAVIPEPGTWAAMAATVLGLAFWRARRKRS